MIVDDKIKRKLLFTVCNSRQTLHDWVQVFLGLDLPGGIVDPRSNSTPLDLLWEIYQKALDGTDPNFTQVLLYSCRDGYKSVLCSIMEVISLFHFRRDCVHLAALLDQSQRTIRYISRYFSRPILRDFIVSKNKRTIEVMWYENSVDDIISVKEYDLLEGDFKNKYKPKKYTIQVLVASVDGVNSPHCSFVCVDGKTKMLTRTKGNTNRIRKSTTAKGVFSLLTGAGQGGCPPGPNAEEISVDASNKNIEVLSLDIHSGEFEFKKVVSGYRKRASTIRVITDTKSLVCTKDHPVWVLGKGFVQSGELVIGDKLIKMNKAKIIEGVNHCNKNRPDFKVNKFDRVDSKEVWEQVLLGTLMGDTGIYRRGTSNPYISFRHCLEQKDYCEWKREILSEKLRLTKTKKAYSGYTGAEQVAYYSGNTAFLKKYMNMRIVFDLLEDIGPMALAVWYMDDGCAGRGIGFSTEGWNQEENYRLAEFLGRKFGLEVYVCNYSRNGKTYYALRGGVEAKRRLVEICKPYIHPSMAYKFDIQCHLKDCIACGKEFWVYETHGVTCGSPICRMIHLKTLHTSEVKAIEPLSMQWVYDFTVEDNNNFWSNQFLSKNCLDELDLTKPGPLEEAKMIPAPGEERGELPITFYTSSRKFAFGNVQKMIDAANESGLIIRHWSIIDVTKACPASRHRPDLPKIPIYTNDKDLSAISEESYDNLDELKKVKYEKSEGYSGCLSNCRIYGSCLGRLATEQKGSSKLLKSIDHVQGLFRSVSSDYARAQLLCLKPSLEGMVYPNIDHEVHLITAAQMAEILDGEEHPLYFSKEDLIELFRQREARFCAGLDHGFTHNFAVVVGAVDGNRCFMIEAHEAPQLELAQKIELLEAKIKRFDPIVYPDTSYPADNKTLKRYGFRITNWSKYPGSVVDGIDAVRMKLKPISGPPELYFLKGDSGVENLFKKLMTYHWKLDSQGNPTDIPDEEDDDSADCQRYLIMNVFGKRGKVVATKSTIDAQHEQAAAPTWIQKEVEGIIGDTDVTTGPSKGKKGRFSWSF